MNDKPKCPVFGCTIPRGIPHEHPAGVSAVIRDPVEPLNARERGELMHYRMQAGHASYEANMAKASVICNELSKEIMNDLDGRHDHHGIRMVTPQETFAHSVGRIAFWMIVSVAAIAFTGLALYVWFNDLAGWWS